MDNFIVLIAVGLIIGTCGTLIGAGGGFLLVPLLLLTHPHMPPEIVTAISIAIVAMNAISGSIAYARSRRIDYKAGLLFAACTIPGSILGVYLTNYISRRIFDPLFGILLIMLSLYLFVNNRKRDGPTDIRPRDGKQWTKQSLTDKEGQTFTYSYNRVLGVLISIVVGFLSPLLGIGGGIIHVPAMVQWLQFPVYVATATSHFILAIMSTISVVVHAVNGHYNHEGVMRMAIGLSIGVIPGAQFGAWLSHRIPTTVIIRILSFCLGLVGIRILMISFQ